MQMAWFSDTVLQIVIEVAVTRGSGALARCLGRKAAQEVSVYVVRKAVLHSLRSYLKRRFAQIAKRELLVGGAKAVGKALVSFSVAFAKAYGEGKSYKRLRQDLEKKAMHHSVFNTAIARGVGAFVTTLISETVGKDIASGIDKGGFFESELKKWLTTRFTQLLTVDSFNVFIGALWDAYVDCWEKKHPKLEAALSARLKESLTKLLVGEVKKAAGLVPSQLGGASNDTKSQK